MCKVIVLTTCIQVYSVHVRVNTDHVLGLLLEKEQFNIARKYAELVNSTKSQISIKEVRGRPCSTLCLFVQISVNIGWGV